MKEGGEETEENRLESRWDGAERLGTAAQRIRKVSIGAGTRSNVSKEKAGAIWRRPHQVKMQTSFSIVSLPAMEVKKCKGEIPFFISIKCLNL